MRKEDLGIGKVYVFYTTGLYEGTERLPSELGIPVEDFNSLDRCTLYHYEGYSYLIGDTPDVMSFLRQDNVDSMFGKDCFTGYVDGNEVIPYDLEG